MKNIPANLKIENLYNQVLLLQREFKLHTHTDNQRRLNPPALTEEEDKKLALYYTNYRANMLWKNPLFLGRSNDGLTETTSVATITREPLKTIFECVNATDYAILSSAAISSAGGSSLQYNSQFEFNCLLDITQTVDQDIFFGIANFALTGVPANATSTTVHIGFFVQDGILWASFSDGVVQTKLDISSGVSLSSQNRFRIEVQPDNLLEPNKAGFIKFYVNGVEKYSNSGNNRPYGSASAFKLWFGLQKIDGVNTHQLDLFNTYNIILKNKLDPF